MTLADTGPLIALLDRRDQHHQACYAVVQRLPFEPLFTTWPCFTEAMYLLGERGGHRYQKSLWDFRATGRLVLKELSPVEANRMAVLMEKYRDAPMDLADASLVALAESGSVRRVFTTDGHFRIYRLPDGSTLEMIP